MNQDIILIGNEVERGNILIIRADKSTQKEKRVGGEEITKRLMVISLKSEFV